MGVVAEFLGLGFGVELLRLGLAAGFERMRIVVLFRGLVISGVALRGLLGLFGGFLRSLAALSLLVLFAFVGLI